MLSLCNPSAHQSCKASGKHLHVPANNHLASQLTTIASDVNTIRLLPQRHSARENLDAHLPAVYSHVQSFRSSVRCSMLMTPYFIDRPRCDVVDMGTRAL